MKIDPNSPAIPIEFHNDAMKHYDVLTIRQKIAAMAMQGILSNPNLVTTLSPTVIEWVSMASFKQAEAWISEGDK